MRTFLHVVFWTLVALPLVLLALALVGGTLGHFSLQKSIKIAAESLCPKCGQVIGRAAVQAAIKRQAEALRSIMKQYLRPRIKAVWRIECPHCGATLPFHPDENRFEEPSSASPPPLACV
jgi:predicted RNA-binding Zn-ribbon protein involved in translation (DUF1610 family)